MAPLCSPSRKALVFARLTPPPTPACGAAARQVLPPPAPPTRPDTGGNRCGRQPATEPASCLLFGGCAGERVRGGLLRVRRRRDRVACSIRFLSPPRRGCADRHRAATRAALGATSQSCSSLSVVAFCRLRVP